jgi:N-acyl homoserine lactone hydrolase
MVLPKATANMEQAMETYRRLDGLRKGGTHILFGHDGLQWQSVTEGVPLVL